MSTYVFKVAKNFAYTTGKGVYAMFSPTLDPQLVGEVIAARRREKGISQEVLSGLADIGRTHLSAIERGERKPTLETLYRIACALDVPMSALVLDMEAEMARRQSKKRP